MATDADGTLSERAAQRSKPQWQWALTGVKNTLAFLLSLSQAWLALLRREFYLIWRFIRYDVPSTIIPGLLFTLVSWKTQPQHDAAGLVLALGRAIVYFVLYIYLFTLSNQIVGVAEDRINKPDRPLVRGECTRSGALLRWIIAAAAFLVVAWFWNVFIWAVLWLAMSIIHNFGKAGHFWLTKNIIMGLGILAELAPAWQLVHPLAESTWIWVLFLSVAVFMLIPLQDLRDMKGDQVLGRRTFPLFFGAWPTRWWVGSCSLALSLAIYPLLLCLHALGWQSALWAVVVSGLSLVMAWRVLFLRTARADHQTYMLLCWLYCLLVGGALLSL